MLDHIELICELGDLADVPPTSHVIDVENALREDVPRPSLPVEKALENAPDAALRRLPRALPGGRHDRVDRGAGRQAVQGRRPRRWRVLRVLPPAGGRGRVQLLRLGRPSRRREFATHALLRVPIAVKDLFCTEGIRARPARDPRGLSRDLILASSKTHGRRRHTAGQDQPGRVRDGLLDRELGLRPDAQPLGHRPASRRFQRRQRGLGCGRHRAVVARHRHGRLDPPARRAVRDCRLQADLRRGQPLRPRSRSPPRSTRPGRSRATSTDFRAAALPSWSAADPCDSHEHSSPTRPRSSCPPRTDPEGRPPRRAGGGTVRRGNRSRAC